MSKTQIDQKTLKQAREILAAWQKSPLIRHRSFSDKELWGKQEEILWALREHKYVAVKSGNTIGKSFIAADVVMDFLTVNYPAKVITTAPTFVQVESILWKEIANYVNTARIPIEANLLKTELVFNDEWFAMGISTNEVYRFQGFHSPNLLVVIDEASGVPPEIWEAVHSLHPTKILAIGNPTEITGDFYNCFTSDLWHKITVSCYDAVKWQKENHSIPGLVTSEWIEERRGEWGDKSPQFAIHVLGEFPEQSEGALINRLWVERARKGVDLDNQKIDNLEEDSPRVLAADVATKHGNSVTVIGYRYGHTLSEIKGYLQIPTTQTTQILALDYLRRRACNLVVDSDGIGEGVADGLHAKKVPVTEFHGGYAQKAIDATKFKNLRSQFYWIVAKKFEKGMYDLSKIPEKEYELLKNQLCSIKVKPNDSMGRIQIETKEDLMTRGIRSPDFADCFVYLEYSFYTARFQELRPYKYL